MRYCILWMIVCLLFIFPLTFTLAQEEQEADSEPADPAMILPSVVLEIEDLSIETIETVLPEEYEYLSLEREVLAAEREVPLPEEKIMEVKEPVPVVTLPDHDTSLGTTDSSFVAEALLGAGYVNNILSQISFYKLGTSPKYKLLFSHETLDGFAFHDAGTGFNMREDSLEGSIKGSLGKLESGLSGHYYEVERGLQGQGDYFSHISRFIDGTASFSILPTEIVNISADIASTFTSMSLTGTTVPEIDLPYPPLEIVASAAIGSEFTFESFHFGINSLYKYRNLVEGEDFELHRILARAYCGIELPLTFILNTDVGYFYNSDDLWLIPFHISLSANPIDSFSFRVAGGYRREEYDLFSVWRNLAYTGFTVTEAIENDIHGYPDNYGWYGEGGVKLNMDNRFVFSLSSTLSSNSSILRYPDETEPDTSTGLYHLEEIEDILKMTGEFGLGINVAAWLYLNLKTTGYVLFEENPESWMEVACEGIAATEEGHWGGSFSLGFYTDFERDLELPTFDIALFFKISDNIRIIGEGYDLFSPFMENGRIERGVYVSPGIRGTFKVHINF